MNSFMKAIETLKKWIGIEKRSGVERRVKLSRRKNKLEILTNFYFLREESFL